MKKDHSIETSILNIQERMTALEESHHQTTDEYKELLELRERMEKIKAINPMPSINPNVAVEVGGKVLVAAAVLAIEKSGVLTTKIPLASMINFRK